MKKKVVVLLISLFCLWVALGLLARRSILSLISEHGVVVKSNCADLAFGVRFDSAVVRTANEVVWFDELENEELRNCLSCSELGGCLSGDQYFMNEKGYMSGIFYIVPKWLGKLGIENLLLPLLHQTEFFYWPSKHLLYLSEDIEELGYDLCRGLNVTNVYPRTLKR